MFEPTLTIVGFTVRTYTFLLALVVSGAIGGLAYRAPATRRGAFFDVGIGGLLGSLVVGRAVHVALNWAYFAHRTGDITALHLGGLAWHGVVVGALLGMGIVAYWRQITLSPLLDRLTLILPLGMLATWWGCRAALCAWGAEVTSMADYPPIMTWEAMDGFGLLAPRFQTQTLGMLIALTLCIVALLMYRVRWLAGRRVWLMLVLLCLADSWLALLRGDYAPLIAGVRAELWLNLWLGGAALIVAARARYSGSDVSNN